MRNATCLCLACLALSALLSAGCTSVASAVAGGAILTGGSQAISDTATDTLDLHLTIATEIARAVLGDLDLTIIKDAPTRRGGALTRWDFEAVTLGDEAVSIDVTLVQISRRLTQVSVRASKGWLRPDLPTAETIIDRISHDAARRMIGDAKH